jgi:hypothetical protein
MNFVAGLCAAKACNYSSELPLRQKTHDLCEDILPYMHPRTDFGSAAKMQISKPGQVVCDLSICA